MKCWIGMRFVILVLWLLGSLIGPLKVIAAPPSMSDYTASPPFITKVVPPNILLLLDISGSLNIAAYSGLTFDPAATYTGLFEPAECYGRNSGRFEPDPDPNPATPGVCANTTYPWSGNLLNFATMRRIDIVKRVMTGGTCSVSRDTGGYCPAGGSNVIKAQDAFNAGACCLNQTMSVATASATGRVPAAVLSGLGATVYFHLKGSTASLMGAFCLDDDGTQPPSGTCDDSDAYNETALEAKLEIRVHVTVPQGGVIQQVGTKARIGLMTFNVDEGAGMRTNIGASLTDTITTIDAAVPSTWTPLAESLYEATRYYAQIAPFYSSTDYTVSQSTDPYYFQAPQWASTSGYVDCCKSFVIVFTDGEPTQDLNIPADLRDFAHPVHGAHCTTDPDSNPCSPHKEDYALEGSHYLDDVAYFAHTTDLRQGTIPVLNATGQNLAGSQNLTVYTFYAFGQPIGREILKSTAKAGGFEDQNGNNLPDLTQEWDSLNNMTGAATPDGLPDTYFESASADDLKDRLVSTIYSILKRSASGTAASVVASSTTGEGATYQAYFYPSVADAEGEVKWTGYLHSLFVDALGHLREDSGPGGTPDGRLIYQHDKIVVTRYDPTSGEVLVDRYADANGDGKPDSATCSPCGAALKDLVPIWEAGKRLALRDPADRKILTWVDTDNDGLVDSGEQVEFTAASPDNSATLAPYLLAEGTGTAPFTAANLIQFIRGVQVTGLRNRSLTVGGAQKVWKLGDIVHSTPVVVGPPKERYDVIYGDPSYSDFFTKYKNRRTVAYVGANDGMLHAFNVGFYHRGDDPATGTTVEHGWFTLAPSDNSGGPPLGDELWGFIPYHLLPQLQWLARDDYIHTYYVDLKPKVTDARIFAPDADHPNGWGTILIGGFRMGGSCKDCPNGNGKEVKFNPGGGNREFYSAYFVLDITNPEVGPRLLWSFTDQKLGFTTSYPTVLRVNPTSDLTTSEANAKWFVLLGSGPTGYDGRSGQEGRLFAIDLKTGPGSNNANVTDFQSGQSGSTMGDLISLDANLDYRTDVVYGGSVIDKGSSPWTGRLYRLTTGTNGTAPFGGTIMPANWGRGNKVTILLGDFACSTAGCTGANEPGPIPTAPGVTMDDSSNIWVFAGTGRFYDPADNANTDTQYFFGLRDPVLIGSCTETDQKNCQQKDLVNVSRATVCVVCTGNQVTDPTNASVTALMGTATTTLQGLVASKQGWYTTLLPPSGPPAGERVLASPTVIGGIVLFPSFTPTAGNLCSGGTGTGSLYALFYLTGSAYQASVIGTVTVSGNTNVKRSTALGAGLASQVGIHIGAQGTDTSTDVTSRVKACSQMSTGALTCIQTQPALGTWSRYLSWINLRL